MVGRPKILNTCIWDSANLDFFDQYQCYAHLTSIRQKFLCIDIWKYERGELHNGLLFSDICGQSVEWGCENSKNTWPGLRDWLRRLFGFTKFSPHLQRLWPPDNITRVTYFCCRHSTSVDLRVTIYFSRKFHPNQGFRSLVNKFSYARQDTILCRNSKTSLIVVLQSPQN